MLAWERDDVPRRARCAYGGLSKFIGSLNEAQSLAPTRCTGWVVRDLILHLLGDAQRDLVALATDADTNPDKDAVTYWRDTPGAPDLELRGVRSLRSMASQSSLRYLSSTHAETAAAVRALARRTPPDMAEQVPDELAARLHTFLAEDQIL